MGGGNRVFNVTESTTDEYIRNGEVLSLSIPIEPIFLVFDQTFWAASTLEGQAVFTRGGVTIATEQLSFSAFAPNAKFVDLATSSSFTVPAGADTVSFNVTLNCPLRQDLGINVTQSPLFSTPLTIIGAYEPSKLVLFDTDGATYRMRVLEGEDLAAGAQATFVYTDYRVETLLDSDTLDLTVGHYRTAIDRGGDLGSPQPHSGQVNYEV